MGGRATFLIDHAVLFEPPGAWRQQVPAETAVADATLEDEHRRIGDLPHVMPDADLGADVAVRDGRINKGDNLLFEGIGGGFSWGSLLVEY